MNEPQTPARSFGADPEWRGSPRLFHLIAAINQKARAAQAGAFAYLFVGLLVLTTAFSTSDFDLITDQARPIPDINVQMPAVATLALGPILFAALHIFTLVRYDMLIQDLQAYKSEISSGGIDPHDSIFYSHLLPNVEFVYVVVRRHVLAKITSPAATRDSVPKSWIPYLITWLMLMLVPLSVLALVEISTLRLQNSLVTTTQRLTIYIDGLFLVWFLFRNLERANPSGEKEESISPTKLEKLLRYIGLWCILPLIHFIRQCLKTPSFFWKFFWRGILIALIPILVLIYGTIPSSTANTYFVQSSGHTVLRRNTVLRGRRQSAHPLKATKLTFSALFEQPLDLFLCPSLHWGCRYLRLAGQRLAANKGPAAELNFNRRNLRYADFRDVNAANASFWGADLSNATFEFAHLNHTNFDNAQLQRVNFRHAHMTGATFRGSNLQHADLSMAVLKRANFAGAHLTHAHMFKTTLDEANMTGAFLQAAMLFDASFAGTNLSGANLTFAFLGHAHLPGADLHDARMPGAYMEGAQLWGADLRDATLDGADLHGADLLAADLSGARLYGAQLSNTNFVGADLSGARLYGARTGSETKIAYTDVGDLDTITPLDPSQAKNDKMNLTSAGVYQDFKSVVVDRIVAASSPPVHYSRMQFADPHHTLFVERYPQTHFPSLSQDMVMYISCPAANRCGKSKGIVSSWISHTARRKDWLFCVSGRSADKCADRPSGTPDSYEDHHAAASTSKHGSPRLCEDHIRVPLPKGDSQLVSRQEYDYALSECLLHIDPWHSDLGSRQAYEFGLAQRALEEGSADDSMRNQAIAYADVQLILGGPATKPITALPDLQAALMGSLARTSGWTAGPPQEVSVAGAGTLVRWTNALKVEQELKRILKRVLVRDPKDIMAIEIHKDLPKLVSLAREYRDFYATATTQLAHGKRPKFHISLIRPGVPIVRWLHVRSHTYRGVKLRGPEATSANAHDSMQP